MPAGILDGRVEGSKTLNEHLALDIASPGPATDLGEQLEGALTRAEIRLMETQVGMNDAHQSDIREMQSLSDHLGAHQNINFANPEIGEDAPIILLPLQGIRIHAFDPSVREPLTQRILNALGADARKPDGRITTTRGRAMFRNRFFMAANMAEQPSGGPVIGQRNRTIGASGHMTALGALQRR